MLARILNYFRTDPPAPPDEDRVRELLTLRNDLHVARMRVNRTHYEAELRRTAVDEALAITQVHGAREKVERLEGMIGEDSI
jgi:hypothetical protein